MARRNDFKDSISRILFVASFFASVLLAPAITEAAGSDEVGIACGDTAALIAAMADPPVERTIDLNTDGQAQCLYPLTVAYGSECPSSDWDGHNFRCNGLPPVATRMRINGHGSTIARVGTQPCNGLCTDLFRILEVTSSGALTIDETTIADGDTCGMDKPDSCQIPNPLTAGAGILNAGNLTMTNSGVVRNTGFLSGGGIVNTGSGVASLIGTSVTDNFALFGGAGIWNEGSLRILEGTVARNRALFFAAGIGNYYGNLDVRDSSIIDNEVTSAFHVSPNRADGGGIWTYGDVTISDSLVKENSALYGQSGRGGGIFADASADVRVFQSRVVGNSSGSGGGIYGAGSSALTYIKGAVRNNHAFGKGGGIYWEAPLSAFALRVDFIGNTPTNCAPARHVIGCQL